MRGAISTPFVYSRRVHVFGRQYVSNAPTAMVLPITLHLRLWKSSAARTVQPWSAGLLESPATPGQPF